MKSTIILPRFSVIAAADSIGFGHLPSNFQTSSNPNATGSATLSAIDNYSSPSSPKSINWETTINITEQFPGNGDNNIRVTNSVISFVPPYNPFTGDSNWDTCAIVFMNVSRDATVKGQDDDGSCTQTLGEGCVTAFKQYLAAQRLAAIGANHTGFCGGMQINDLPDACQGVMGLDISAGDLKSVNESNPFMYSMSGEHDVSNTTSYESAATRIWPIALIQSPSNSSESAKPGVGLSCLRAKTSTPGSKEIGDVPGAGVRVELGVWSLIGVLAVMSLLL